MFTYEEDPYFFSVVTYYLQMPWSNHSCFLFFRVSGLNKCTYKGPFENICSFVKHFVELHQLAILFHQENASEKISLLSNSSGKIYLQLCPPIFKFSISLQKCSLVQYTLKCTWGHNHLTLHSGFFSFVLVCLFLFFFPLSLFSFFLSGPHMALNSDLFQGPLFAMSCVRSLGHDFLVMWSEVKASIMPLVLGLSAVVVWIVGMNHKMWEWWTDWEWQCPEGGKIASLSISRYVW